MIKNACILACFIALICSGCSTGSHIVTGTARPALTVEAVKLYPSIPAGAEIIGQVSATADTDLSWQHLTDRAVARLRSEAAKIGANGLVVGGHANDVWGGTATVTGTAIFVP